MEGTIRELQDKEGNKVYPVSKAECIYMPNGVDTVGRVLGDMQDQDTEITFPSNRVEKKLDSGNTVVTEFKSDGSIVETTTSDKGILLKKKITTFNEDGSISIKVEGD